MPAASWSRVRTRRCLPRKVCTRACGRTRVADSWGMMPRCRSRSSRRPPRRSAFLTLGRVAGAGQHATQVLDGREHLVVPVTALGIVGTLFVLHDLLVLAEDVFREPGDERPRRVDETRDGRLLDR